MDNITCPNCKESFDPDSNDWDCPYCDEDCSDMENDEDDD